MKRVFLGGTCNESKWRDDLISKLDPNLIEYFNPVVEDWTKECMEIEKQERQTCDFCLYTITPKMAGVYSIAEVVDDSNKRPNKTILCILDKDESENFTKSQLKSLKQVGEMVKQNGGQVFTNLDDVAKYLNKNGNNRFNFVIH